MSRSLLRLTPHDDVSELTITHDRLNRQIVAAFGNQPTKHTSSSGTESKLRFDHKLMFHHISLREAGGEPFSPRVIDHLLHQAARHGIHQIGLIGLAQNPIELVPQMPDHFRSRHTGREQIEFRTILVRQRDGMHPR